MKPFDANLLTEPEQAVQDEQSHRTCWQCRHLKRHARSGYHGCELGGETAPVISGEIHCEEWEVNNVG